MDLLDAVNRPSAKMVSSSRKWCQIVAPYLIIVLTHVYTWRVISACTHEDTPFFSNQPKDVILKKGGDAYLNCTVSRSDDRRDFLTWQVKPRVYQTKVSLSFDHGTCQKTSHISIFNVSEQTATAKCILRHITDLQNWQIFHSAVATIRVAYFPSNEEIKCGPQNVRILHDIDNLTAWCEVPVGHPPVSIIWRVGGETSLPHSIKRNLVQENGIFFLNETFQTDHSFHSSTVSCVVISHVFFPDQEIHCQVGPFIVLYKPNVDIIPSDVQLLSDAQELQLTCSVESFPEVDTIAWTCHPKNILDGCDGKTGASVVFSIARNSSNFERYQLINVVCSATNSIGKSTAWTGILTKRSLNRTDNDSGGWAKDNHDSDPISGPICISAVPNLQPLDMPVMDNDIPDMAGQALFMCAVECDDNIVSGSRPVKWSINNIPILDDKNFHVRNLGSFAGSIITVNFFDQTASHFNISCDSFINNRTVRREITFKVSGDEVRSETSSLWINHNYFGGITQGSVQTLGNKSSPFPTTTPEEQIWDGATKSSKDSNFFGFEGTQFILTAVIGIVMSILFAACLCAFCTVLLYRYLQKKDKNSDILAQMLEMSKQNRPFQQHDRVTSQETEETTLDQNYEEPVAAPFLPCLPSFSQNDCSYAKRLPCSNGLAGNLSGSSMSCSSCGSTTSSPSTDAYSNASKQSVEYDWDDHLHS